MKIRDIPADASTLLSALPRHLPGGDAGVLLLHGYTGTPRDFAGMADHLQSTGFAVSVPRLPGHGTVGMDFLHAGARDWLRAAVDAWMDLRAKCGTVHVVGHSMGGVLAALLASRFPVARLVLLAPAFRFANRLLGWSGLVGLFVSRFKRKDSVATEASDSDTTALSREYWQWRYPRQAASYLRIRRMAVRALPRVTADTLVILGQEDRSVPATVVTLLHERMTSAILRSTVCRSSPHRLLTGPDAADINAAVTSWLSDGPSGSVG